MKKAVILFSGGLDSTTCLALAQSQGFECYTLSFNYNQRHQIELRSAAAIADKMRARHRVITLPTFGESSALVGNDQVIPDYNGKNEIPATYVPARNTIFLSFALAWAEVLQARDIFIGVSSVDYSGYPDCRPEYLEAFERLANLATKIGVEENNIRLHAPLSRLSKAETVQLGMSLGVDYGATVSCYQADEDGRACGRCDSCTLRKKGFADAKLEDPTRYR